MSAVIDQERVRQREKHEADFHDEEYERQLEQYGLDLNQNMLKYYTSPRNRPIERREWCSFLMGKAHNKLILDLGCGFGEKSVYFAVMGASVIAGDLSYNSARITHLRSIHNNVGEKIHAIQMSGHGLPLRSDSIDIIHCFGVLHHLDLGSTVEEVHRVLKKGGKGIFCEPIEDSFIMTVLHKTAKRICKRGQISDCTESEQPMTLEDIHSFGQYFAKYEFWQFLFLARAISV